jgi:hypothetical protein
MATIELAAPSRSAADQPVVGAVTVIMGTVVGLTFLFGFGNVLTLALRLGVPVWVAPLIAPAVDLSILGLLLGTRHLALHGATPEELRPACRLLIFASLTTLALNIAEPIVTGQYGKAAFDAVGPLLLIGWAEVGPGLLQAITTTGLSEARPLDSDVAHGSQETVASSGQAADEEGCIAVGSAASAVRTTPFEALDVETSTSPVVSDDLIERARREDARHWAQHQRPISAETLRKQLRIGAVRSRMLVSVIRADQAGRRAARLRPPSADVARVHAG